MRVSVVYTSALKLALMLYVALMLLNVNQFLRFLDSLLFPRISGSEILEFFLCNRTLNCKENTLQCL